MPMACKAAITKETTAASVSLEQSSQTFSTNLDDQLHTHRQASRTDVIERLTAQNSATVPANHCATARKGAGSVWEISRKPLDFLC